MGYSPLRANQLSSERYFFPDTTQYHRRGNYFFPAEEDEEDCFLSAAFRADEERRARNERALREQAYLEAMERKRRQKLIEEEERRKRQQHQQYLIEMKRRRREEEAQRELERQFMVHLDHKRQEKRRDEKMRSQRAYALEQLNRQEIMKRAAGRNVEDCQVNEELIQGLDGNIYRIVRSNQPVALPRRQPNQMSGPAAVQQRDQSLVKDCTSLTNIESSQKQCITQKDENDLSNKPRKKKSAKLVRSSVLIGEVEDASDSECEEEFNDCWHNRRPQHGEWIEPVSKM